MVGRGVKGRNAIRTIAERARPHLKAVASDEVFCYREFPDNHGLLGRSAS